MECLIVLILFIYLVFPGLTLMFFFYEHAYSPRFRQIKEELDTSLIKTTLKWYGFSLITLFFTFLRYPLFLMPKIVRPKAKDNKQPLLVLVHGLYHNNSAWLFYRRWLKKAGIKNVYLWSYGSFRSDFHSISRNLDQFLSRIIQENTSQELILIGHSLGGLLCKYSASQEPIASKVCCLITLGTPFQGSKLTLFASGSLAKELAYQGPLVQRLQTSPAPTDCKKIALYSPMDNMVLPAESLFPPDPDWEQVQAPPVGHLSMLYSKKTFSLVLNRLKSKCLKQTS